MASPPRTHTPPPSGPPLSVGSSPVSRISKYFVAHKREQFQAFGYDETIHDGAPFLTTDDFLKFLRVRHSVYQPPTTIPALSVDAFIDTANVLSTSIQTDHFPNMLLEFKYMGDKALIGHVTDTLCRPDITAAFKSDWELKEVTHWSCAKLAGERASKGKTIPEQERNAVSYLHYLLLARPDLHVAHGLLIDKKRIRFLFGIGRHRVRYLDVPWTNEGLYKLLYAFVYRLYYPDHFTDESYIRMISRVNGTIHVEYTVKISIPSNGSTTLDCTGFSAISARHPFTTRTHVLSNASFQGGVNVKALTVLKDQVCRIGTRFDEQIILEHIHYKGVVPGVVEVVHHESLRNLWSEPSQRERCRLGLRQLGLPFTSMPTARKMLELLFDVLEVLRYL